VSASSPAAPLAVTPAGAVVARRWLILAVICAAQFAASMDDTIVNTALPSIRAELGFDDRALSWVVNAYMLLFGGFLLFGGRAADVIGRRRMFLVGVTAFTAFSAVCGLSGSAELLIGGRGFQGLSAALLSPAALAILMVNFPEGPQRTRALGIWAGLMGLGAAVGLVAGGAITETIGWRWVFFINVPIGALVLAAALRLLPADAARDDRARLDTPGAILATAGLLAIVFSIVEAPDHGWGAPRTLAGLAGGALALAAFAVHERRSRQPLVPPALVARRAVRVANAVMLLAAGGMLALFFCMTLYVQVVQGWTPLRAGLSAMVFSLVFVGVSGLSTRLVERFPIRPMVSAGCTIAAGGLLLMTRLQPDSTYVEALLPALVIAGIGMGLAFVPLTAAATSGVEGRDAGVVSGLLSTCQQIGGAIGIAVLVTVASDHTAALVAAGTPQADALSAGFHAAFRVDAALLLAAALLAPLLGRVKVSGPPVLA
jgi:EmrB/QacA subfamily drug resistance transporter